MITRIILAFAVASSFATVRAQVALPEVFADNMVLQRDLPVSIWGTAAVGEAVEVSFKGQAVKTVGGADGRWKIRLTALKADSSPDILTVKGTNTVTIRNVLVGEVWLASGQSNMGMNIAMCKAAKDSELKNDLPGDIRISGLSRMEDDFDIGVTAGWHAPTRQNLGDLPALAYFFARNIRQTLNVPVGVVVRSVGGTQTARWFPPGAFENEPDAAQRFEKYKTEYPRLKAEYDRSLEAYKVKKELLDSDPAAYAQKYGKGRLRKPVPPLPVALNAEGGDLYNQFVRPVAPFTARGLIWDQGEFGTAMNAIPELSTAFRLLANGWRRAFESPDMPFLFVQKPSGYGAARNAIKPLPESPESDPAWKNGAYIEDQIKAIAAIPNSGLCLSADLPEGLHPTAKDQYGQRLAQVALKIVYGRDVVCYGPTFKSAKIEGDKIRIQFENIGGGLISADGSARVQGFCIAGNDGKFLWAEAVIDNDSVIVSSPKVAAPLHVRYAWSGKPVWAGLFNREGFPAPTFRTDTEKMAYVRP